MLAAWIRMFVDDNVAANRVVQQWAEVITAGFENGSFDPVSLVAGCLDKKN